MCAIASAVADSEGDDTIRLEPSVLRAFDSAEGNLVESAEDFSGLCLREGIHVRCFFEMRRSNIGQLLDRSDLKVSLQEKHC